MTNGVLEGERGTCAHCSTCGLEIEGWTEGKTWEIAREHVANEKHDVMMHWRVYLSPIELPVTPDGMEDV